MRTFLNSLLNLILAFYFSAFSPRCLWAVCFSHSPEGLFSPFWFSHWCSVYLIWTKSICLTKLVRDCKLVSRCILTERTWRTVGNWMNWITKRVSGCTNELIVTRGTEEESGSGACGSAEVREKHAAKMNLVLSQWDVGIIFKYLQMYNIEVCLACSEKFQRARSR